MPVAVFLLAAIFFIGISIFVDLLNYIFNVLRGVPPDERWMSPQERFQKHFKEMREKEDEEERNFNRMWKTLEKRREENSRGGKDV